jgi:hypothetical protein
MSSTDDSVSTNSSNNSASKPELCIGTDTAARFISQNGVFANFVINFGSVANPVGQKCKTVGQTIEFAPIRENSKTTYTRKAICTKTAKGIFYVEKAVKLLPYCTGIQLASLTNIKRQETAVSNLRSLYQTAYQKAEMNYQNALALGNTQSANIAKIDMESAKSQENKYLTQLEEFSRQRDSLLSKCRIQDPNAQGASGSSSSAVKKMACTSSEKTLLRSLASQYSSAQNVVRIDDETFGKLKELFSSALNSAKSAVAAQYQVELSKLNVRIQQDISTAKLIKTEFTQLNSGCLNSGVSLETEYRVKYYP